MWGMPVWYLWCCVLLDYFFVGYYVRCLLVVCMNDCVLVLVTIWLPCLAFVVFVFALLCCHSGAWLFVCCVLLL